MTEAAVTLTTEPVELEGVDPADPPTEHLPGRLWQGGLPVDFGWMRSHEIDVVVDLADADTVAPADPVAGLTYLKCPLVDGEELPDEVLTTGLARLVGDLVRSGRQVLVHCTFGRNRSGLLAALVVRDVQGITGEEALRHVQERRPGAVNNETFAGWLARLPAPNP